MSNSTVPNARQEYIEGLRKLADLLESTPDLPTPRMSNNTAEWMEFYDAAEVARIATLVPGTMRKNDPNASDFNAQYYELTSDVKLGPFKLVVSSFRDTVCERVQTGTKTVVVAAVEAAPERVEEQPVYEFVCSPLLAKAVAS